MTGDSPVGPDSPVGRGTAARATDAVEPDAALVDLDGAQELLGLGPDEVMGLVEDGVLAPAPAAGEDLKFRVGEVEAVRLERR